MPWTSQRLASLTLMSFALSATALALHSPVLGLKASDTAGVPGKDLSSMGGSGREPVRTAAPGVLAWPMRDGSFLIRADIVIDASRGPGARPVPGGADTYLFRSVPGVQVISSGGRTLVVAVSSDGLPSGQALDSAWSAEIARLLASERLGLVKVNASSMTAGAF